MIARSIMLAEDIKVEGVNVVMKSLVIKEELRYQAKILAVSLLVLSINLKNRDSVISIDFISWRVPHSASLRMPDKLRLEGEEVETVLTDV
jgi:hypothetical protein